ncbi:MAG: putative GDP-6-deoxy-D-lyxo-4-hexulose reductase [Geminicoccaceae bacterium]|nr:putative GDP-6-deoxy-D-lyxo-4-hexulose reductase [Geminicoccaceae bacterium]
MKVLVTGAHGFIGKRLVRTLLDADHEVVATRSTADTGMPRDWTEDVRVVPLELCSGESVRKAVGVAADAIIHLAAVSYSRDANEDPGWAWEVNAAGTARLLAAVKDVREDKGADPLVIVASSAEVYGQGEGRPRVETEAPRPLNVYGATKLGSEIAATHARDEWDLRVIVVRPFPATGPGYQENRVLNKWIAALRDGQKTVEGDSTIVRDFMDVRDVAGAYMALLGRGRAGETYNLAAGRGVTFGELFAMLAAKLGKDARLVPPTNPRRDALHLVADAGKIQRHTGWHATIPLEKTISDLIDAQAH